MALLVILQKGKALPIGTKRKFAGRWHVKTTEGWKYVPQGRETGERSVSEEKQERNRAVVELAREGRSTKDISEEMGLSAARIHQILGQARKAGVTIDRKKKEETLNERFNYERRERKPPRRDRNRDDTKGVLQPYENDRIKLGRAHISQRPDLDYLSEDIRGTLRPHQQDFVNLAMQKYEEGEKTISNFDGTGAGKTFQEVALAETYMEHHPDAKVLITTENTRIIATAFAGDAKVLGVPIKPITSADEIDGPGIYITKYSRLGDLEEAFDDIDLSIFDEAHNLKNASISRKAQRGIGLIDRSKNVALFTATPIDKAAHLEYLCAAYNLDFKAVMKEFGYKRVGNMWATNHSAIETAERIDSFFEHYAQKGTLVKREVPLEGLEFEIKTIPLSDTSRSKYEKATSRMEQQLAMADVRERGLLKARWLMRIRAVLEEAKIDSAIDAAKAAVAAGRRPVIFATRVNEGLIERRDTPRGSDSPVAKLEEQEVGEIKLLLQKDHFTAEDIAELYGVSPRAVRHVRDASTWKHVAPGGGPEPKADLVKFTEGTLRVLQQRLNEAGITTAAVFGGRSKKALRDVRRFQEGKIDAVITSPQSGGTGISLDDTVGNAPREAIIMTPPFSAVDFVQMPGRVHRLSTKSQSKVTLLSTDTAVEQWNKGIIANKLTTLGASVKGDYEGLSLRDLEMAESMSQEDARAFLKEKGTERTLAAPRQSAFKFNSTTVMKKSASSWDFLFAQDKKEVERMESVSRILMPSEILSKSRSRLFVLAVPSELSKAKGYSDGTIRDWQGKKYIKQGGKWKPYRQGVNKKGEITDVGKGTGGSGAPSGDQAVQLTASEIKRLRNADPEKMTKQDLGRLYNAMRKDKSEDGPEYLQGFFGDDEKGQQVYDVMMSRMRRNKGKQAGGTVELTDTVAGMPVKTLLEMIETNSEDFEQGDAEDDEAVIFQYLEEHKLIEWTDEGHPELSAAGRALLDSK